MSGILRIISGLLVIGTAVYAGFLYRSPWIIVLLTLSFTALYVGGKVQQWRLLARVHGVAGLFKSLLVTLTIQAILSGLFYLVGVGMGAIAGNRSFSERLDSFDWMLAGGLLIFGSVATSTIYVMEARAGEATSKPAGEVSSEMRDIMAEAVELGQQTVAMPVQIFSLARRLADHSDRSEALAAMENFFEDDNAFVRRVAFTAIRFMGQSGRDLDPQALDRRIVLGMSDPAVWVRYDAAWIAGEIKGDDAAFAAGLKHMIETAEAAGADKLAESEAAHKALARARTSLDAVQQRLH